MTDCTDGPPTISHVRGDRLTVTLRFDPDSPNVTDRAGMLELVDALEDADWTGDVKNTAGTVIASFDVTAVRVGDVLTVVAVIDDTEALAANGNYPTDLQARGDTIGRKTFLAGATIFVTGDVTADGGS